MRDEVYEHRRAVGRKIDTIQQSHTTSVERVEHLQNSLSHHRDNVMEVMGSHRELTREHITAERNARGDLELRVDRLEAQLNAELARIAAGHVAFARLETSANEQRGAFEALQAEQGRLAKAWHEAEVAAAAEQVGLQAARSAAAAEQRASKAELSGGLALLTQASSQLETSIRQDLEDLHSAANAQHASIDSALPELVAKQLEIALTEERARSDARHDGLAASVEQVVGKWEEFSSSTTGLSIELREYCKSTEARLDKEVKGNERTFSDFGDTVRVLEEQLEQKLAVARAETLSSMEKVGAQQRRELAQTFTDLREEIHRIVLLGQQVSPATAQVTAGGGEQAAREVVQAAAPTMVQAANLAEASATAQVAQMALNHLKRKKSSLGSLAEKPEGPMPGTSPSLRAQLVARNDVSTPGSPGTPARRAAAGAASPRLTSSPVLSPRQSLAQSLGFQTRPALSGTSSAAGSFTAMAANTPMRSSPVSNGGSLTTSGSPSFAYRQMSTTQSPSGTPSLGGTHPAFGSSRALPAANAASMRTQVLQRGGSATSLTRSES